MPKIKVLIVDDAVVIRKILSEVLSSDQEIEVVGAAANGRIALQKIPQVAPDIITLDVEMPDMNGIETLQEIKKQFPKIPVIMFSTLTERGASVTLDALHYGASDYVAKPANVGSVQKAKEMVRTELTSKIKALALRRPSPGPTIISPSSIAKVVPPLTRVQKFDILAIGTSTGGPNALAEIIPHLPATFPVPVVITQHMPPLFTKMLAERLQAKGNIPVHEAAEGAPLTAGHGYVAPGNYHMVLQRGENGLVSVRLNQDPPENSCRPAVDPMFRSVAEVFGAKVLAVVLTGMGHDGAQGSSVIKEHGGQVIAQDEASSVVWGMPGSVVERGLADHVLPLSAIGPTIARWFSSGSSLQEARL